MNFIDIWFRNWFHSAFNCMIGISLQNFLNKFNIITFTSVLNSFPSLCFIAHDEGITKLLTDVKYCKISVFLQQFHPTVLLKIVISILFHLFVLFSKSLYINIFKINGFLDNCMVQSLHYIQYSVCLQRRQMWTS